MVSSELQSISLPSYDLDDQPICPNYNISVGPTMKVFVVQLPVNGTLYFMNGTELSCSNNDCFINVPYNQAADSYPLRFRPPLNVYSERGEIISNFSFIAVDGITGSRSVEIATLSVNVSHVDRPPIALSALKDVIAERMTMLELSGTGTSLYFFGMELR